MEGEKNQNHTLGTKSNGKIIVKGKKYTTHIYMTADFFGLVVLWHFNKNMFIILYLFVFTITYGELNIFIHTSVLNHFDLLLNCCNDLSEPRTKHKQQQYKIFI